MRWLVGPAFKDLFIIIIIIIISYIIVLSVIGHVRQTELASSLVNFSTRANLF